MKRRALACSAPQLNWFINKEGDRQIELRKHMPTMKNSYQWCEKQDGMGIARQWFPSATAALDPQLLLWR